MDEFEKEEFEALLEVQRIAKELVYEHRRDVLDHRRCKNLLEDLLEATVMADVRHLR